MLDSPRRMRSSEVEQLMEGRRKTSERWRVFIDEKEKGGATYLHRYLRYRNLGRNQCLACRRWSVRYLRAASGDQRAQNIRIGEARAVFKSLRSRSDRNCWRLSFKGQGSNNKTLIKQIKRLRKKKKERCSPEWIQSILVSILFCDNRTRIRLALFPSYKYDGCLECAGRKSVMVLIQQEVRY